MKTQQTEIRQLEMMQAAAASRTAESGNEHVFQR